MSKTHLRLSVIVGIALVLATAAWSAEPAPTCGRIVALGDLHGGYDSLLAMLRKTRLVGEDRRWQSEDGCLVVVGDVVDRGERTRELLDYLIDLEKQADGRVHILLGNHEAMNLVSDLRYVTPEEFAEYAADESKKERQQGYKAFLRSPAARQIDRDQRKAAFDESFPPGWFAQRRAFAPDGEYGAWVLSRPTLLELDGTLFVHGGVEPSFASLDLDELNATITAEIGEYARLRAAFVEEGWLSPLVPFGATFGIVEQRLSPDGDTALGAEERETASGFLDLRHAWFVRSDGPLWSRKLAREDEGAYANTVDRVLAELGVERIVVGHTSQEDHRIKVRFHDRVFLIDTGAGPAYGGFPSALEIEGGTVRAIYPDQVEVLVSPGS